MESDLKQINEVLVSAEWLNNNLGDEKLKVIDASWFMPGSGRNGKDEWFRKRIPGAVFFDFDGEICDRSSPLPHMMPSVTQFEQAVSLLSFGNDDTVVVYDSAGIFSAPRVWWMFKAMGHKQVALLDGGLPAWEAAGFAIETHQPVTPEKSDYKASLMAERIIDRNALLVGINEGSVNVVDVRPADRFAGAVAEPRPGVRSGHMPGAQNLPFPTLLSGGKFKSTDELKALVSPTLSAEKQNVASCGSGVTACMLALAAEHALNRVVTVYDGSWSEWGSDEALPIVKS